MTIKRKPKNYGSKIGFRTAGRKGRGVFALTDIRKGEVIELAPFLTLSARDHKVLSGTDLVRFVYAVGKGRAAIGFGFASLYNHSDTPSADYSIDEKNCLIRFLAVATIQEGEEITIDYGFHPGRIETWPEDYARYMRMRTR